MHPYSTYAARWRAVGVIMLGAVALTSFVNSNASILITSLPLNEFPGVPTFTAFVGLYLLFSRYAWKWPIFSRFTAPPNLNGTWVGKLSTSYDGEGPPRPASDGGVAEEPRLEITQTWTHIEIVGYFATSRSESTSATVMTDKSDSEILFTYRSKPKGEAATVLTMHEGTNSLHYTQDEDETDVLEGTYYTDQQRNNHGEMYFTRASKERDTRN